MIHFSISSLALRSAPDLSIKPPLTAPEALLVTSLAPYSMTDQYGSFIGYEPKIRETKRRQETRQKVHKDLINVLPKWVSYAADKRIDFKKKVLRMLKQTQSTWLLQNEQREVQQEQVLTASAKESALNTPFTPMPIRGTSTRERGTTRSSTPMPPVTRAPRTSMQTFARATTPAHSTHGRAHGYSTARAQGPSHAHAHGQARTPAPGLAANNAYGQATPANSTAHGRAAATSGVGSVPRMGTLTPLQEDQRAAWAIPRTSRSPPRSGEKDNKSEAFQRGSTRCDASQNHMAVTVLANRPHLHTAAVVCTAHDLGSQLPR